MLYSGKRQNIWQIERNPDPKYSNQRHRQTTMVGSGSITGLPDTDKAYFDFDIKRTCVNGKGRRLSPKETIPNSINLPASFNAKGTFKGTINNFSTDLILESSFGPAK
jgi:hypothetical protein